MVKPPPAQTDDKDWTWVLDRACGECGANVGSLSLAEISELNRTSAQRWVEVLAQDDQRLRSRPRPDTWSPLEYACHVRDVYRLFKQRLDLIIDEDNPTFANWDPNISADAERYDLADPESVATELRVAAEELAAAFDRVTHEQESRPAQRSDGARFTLASFARYEVHDPEHHLWDVTGEKSRAGHTVN